MTGGGDSAAVPSVVIAGAGPVGLSLAALLGQAELPVVVLEAGETLSALSQASTFHASTLELLDEIGAAWSLIDTGKATQRLQYRDRDEGLVAEFDFNLLRGLTRFPIRLQTDQTELTRILLDSIRRNYPSVEVRFGIEVRGGCPSEEGAVAVTAKGDVPGRVLVAADGAHSAVRRSLAIPFEGSTYVTRHLMITTSYDVLAHMPELAPVTYVFDGDESIGVLILRNVSRVVFLVESDEPDEQILDPGALQRRLRSFLPPEPGEYPILSARIARLHQRVADRYVEGAIALAGDAAHLNHPLGGMGLNAGIHDAYALAGAIGELLEGDATALDRYGEERRMQALLHVIPTADSYAQTSGESGEVARKRRNEEMRATAADPIRAREYLVKASMFDSVPPARRRP